jgi:TRAP-type C4-dicarboxylate transport system permease small subunit
MNRDDTARPALQRMLDKIALIFLAAGALGILFLVGLTAVSVFWRYVLNDPIFGVQDLSSMTAAVVAGSAVAYGATQNSHITVNMMPKHFGRRVRRLTDLIARGASTVILVLAASALFKKGGCGLACGNITSNLNILHSPFYYLLAASLGFYAVYLVVQLIAGPSHWGGEDPNEAIE